MNESLEPESGPPSRAFDWGLGQVQSVIGQKITVNFRTCPARWSSTIPCGALAEFGAEASNTQSQLQSLKQGKIPGPHGGGFSHAPRQPPKAGASGIFGDPPSPSGTAMKPDL